MARLVSIDAVARVAAMIAAGQVSHDEAIQIVDDLAAPDDGTPSEELEVARAKAERAWEAHR